jgi:trimeric autotransporter adhesin
LRLAQVPGVFETSAGDEGGALLNGIRHTGSIPVGDLDMWSFDAEAGDHLVVRAGGTTFTPQIRLFGPDGAQLEASGTSGTATRDATVQHRTTLSGVFTVVLSSYYIGGSGDYILTLAQAPGVFETSAGDEGGALLNGIRHTGSIPVGDLDMWSFDAEAGDHLVVRAGGTTFTPQIRLFGPDGAQLEASGTSGTATRDATVQHRTTLSGVFTVVLSSYYIGGSGDYILTLAQVPGEFATSPGDEGGPMVNGLQHTGTIDIGDLDVWGFDAVAGDVIILRSGGTGFTPFLRVIGPDGVQLGASGTSGLATREARLQLQATLTGPHTVVMGSYYVGGGGAYGLTLGLMPERFAVADQDEGGALPQHDARQGAIGLGELDFWEFEAGAGHRITLRLRTLGGTGFTSSLQVFGTDGQLLGSGTHATEVPVAFTAPVGGLYVVVVGSGAMSGVGTYELTSTGLPEQGKQLRITYVGEDQVLVNWPSVLQGHVLQESPTLGPEAWGDVDLDPDDNGLNARVRAAVEPGSRVYRLRPGANSAP